MRKRILCSVVATMLVAPFAYSDDDACQMQVCLSTSDMKAGGIGCNDAMKKFFKIKYKKHGYVDIPKTMKKRREKLESCEGAEAGDTEQIMARYGAIIDPKI